MSLTLYTISGAPSPWRVAVGLAIKNIDSKIEMLSVASKDHKTKKYLKLSPRGTVPTLLSDDIILRDSVAILAWLDRAFPEKPLFGQTASEAAAIWQNTMEIVDYLPVATSGILAPIFFKNAEDATDDLLQASDTLKAELSTLEALLDERSFLSHTNPSAADAVAFPHLRLIQRAMDTKPGIMKALGLASLGEHFPNIESWIARMERLPGIAQTFPPHWNEAA